MMKLLPFIPEAVIVGNGEFPSHPFPLHILETVSYVICCDGGADAFVHHTDRVPDWIIGDGDSLSEENRRRFQSIIRYNPDQETNDLTKSVLFLQERGIHRIVIVAATGKREDHTLGNISLLMEYHRQGLEVMVLTDYGFFVPATDTQSFVSFKEQQVSVFSFGTSGMSEEGLVYPLRDFTSWWQGTLNESLGNQFTVHCQGEYLIYRTCEAKKKL